MCLHVCPSQYDTLLPTTRLDSEWFLKAVHEKESVIYYSDAVKQQLESGTNLEDVEVDFCLSVIKQLYAEWLVNLYNFFSTERGRHVICKGWKKAGILGLLDGTTVLPRTG